MSLPPPRSSFTPPLGPARLGAADGTITRAGLIEPSAFREVAVFSFLLRLALNIAASCFQRLEITLGASPLKFPAQRGSGKPRFGVD